MSLTDEERRVMVEQLNKPHNPAFGGVVENI